jgi:hypothetical protein
MSRKPERHLPPTSSTSTVVGTGKSKSTVQTVRGIQLIRGYQPTTTQQQTSYSIWAQSSNAPK